MRMDKNKIRRRLIRKSQQEKSCLATEQCKGFADKLLLWCYCKTSGGKEDEKLRKNKGMWFDWSITLSFLLALNFFRHSTVSCLCIMEATVDRCCKKKKFKIEKGEDSTLTELKYICLFLHVWTFITYTDPGVFEGLSSSDALTGVDRQHLINEIFGLRCYSVPLWGWKL